MKEKTAKQLVKELGLAKLANTRKELSKSQLSALVKIAEDYGKPDLAKQFAGELSLKKIDTRAKKPFTPGSMLEAIQRIDGQPANSFAWYSHTGDGRVIVHTRRSRGFDDDDPFAWRKNENGIWMSGAPPGKVIEADWRSSGHYTQLLNAFDNQGALHGDRVYATLSTDIGTKDRAKQKPGSNTVIKNKDGSPSEFAVEFDKERRWHRLTLVAGQDADIASQ